ncbi:hypothetical protein TWF696_003371 [Orbilia brochopaga]|uniref:DUF4234 domain-containing protein n=1 Tax=Orbilia brochopaga TaxID=3140254 RepID=A0AAV9TXB2_9PEZI
MNLIVDSRAPPDWDGRSFITFFCILSVSLIGGVFWFFRMYGKYQIYERFMADDALMALAELFSVIYSILAYLRKLSWVLATA